MSLVRKRKPYKKIIQVDSSHRYENSLAQNFNATKPNENWVTDISYALTQHGWAYQSTIKDLFDGFIGEYLLGRENSISLVIDTVKLAVQKEKVTEEVLIHSDQGH